MRLNSILLIDDDEITNFYNRHLIEKLGIAEHVHVELHGRAALEYLTGKEKHDPNYRCPDLIFLDINMPIMNGFEFLEAYECLAPEDKGGHLIVMLTTSVLDVDRSRANKFGSLSDYYSKPLNEVSLKKIVSKYF